MIHQVVLKVASRCNLNCTYCYMYNGEDQSYKLQPAKISDEVFDALLRSIGLYCARRPGHSIAICFHGGEPALLGIDRFTELVVRARDTLGSALRSIAIQTNAVLINEHWAATLKELDVATSVSLDGPSEIHDAARVDHRGRGSHAAVVRGIHTMHEDGIPVNVLCVVNPRASGLEAYRYLRSLQIDQMDFLLPDVSHDNKPRLYGGLGPTPVADYLLPIFDTWFREDDPNVRIRIFWGLLTQVLDGTSPTDGFGGNGSGYIIVETNGDIELNDALRVCDEGIGRTGLNVVRDSFEVLEELPQALRELWDGSLPLAPTCQLCAERKICGGGYLPQRYARRNRFDNPSIWCQDILKILAHIRSTVHEYGEQVESELLDSPSHA